MKDLKIIFTMILIATLNVATFAQWSTGVKTGVQFSTVTTDDLIDGFIPDLKYINTGNFAVTTQYTFNDFALYSELAFSKKGFAVRENFNQEILGLPIPLGVDVEAKINYIEMPLLAKYTIGNDRVGFYMMLGPKVGYATKGVLSAQPRLFFSFNEIETEFDLDNVNYERFEISGVGGIGMSVNLGAKSSMFLDARYTHGFNDNINVPIIDAKIQNRSIGVNLGYAYNF